MERRLFVGIKVYPSKQILTLMQKLKLEFPGQSVKWVDLANLHITLKFIGNVETEKIDSISSVFMQICSRHHSYKGQIQELGNFKKKGKTSIIWLGLSDNGQTSKLASEITSGLSALGFKDDNDSFSPHLTIGRVKYPIDERKLMLHMDAIKNNHLQSLIIKEFCLFESVLKPFGPIYSTVRNFLLKIED